MFKKSLVCIFLAVTIASFLGSSAANLAFGNEKEYPWTIFNGEERMCMQATEGQKFMDGEGFEILVYLSNHFTFYHPEHEILAMWIGNPITREVCLFAMGDPSIQEDKEIQL